MGYGDYIKYLPTKVYNEKSIRSKINRSAAKVTHPLVTYFQARTDQAFLEVDAVGSLGAGVPGTAKAETAFATASVLNQYQSIFSNFGSLNAYREVYSNDMVGASAIEIASTGDHGLVSFQWTNNVGLLSLQPSNSLSGYSTALSPFERIKINAATEKSTPLGDEQLAQQAGFSPTQWDSIWPTELSLTPDGTLGYVGLTDRDGHYGFVDIFNTTMELENLWYILSAQSLSDLESEDNITPEITSDLKSLVNQRYNTGTDFSNAITSVTTLTQDQDTTIRFRAIRSDNTADIAVTKDRFVLIKPPGDTTRSLKQVATLASTNADGDIVSDHVEALNRFNSVDDEDATETDTDEGATAPVISMSPWSITNTLIYNDDFSEGTALPISGIGYRHNAIHDEPANFAEPTVIRLIERLGKRWHRHHLESDTGPFSRHSRFVVVDMSAPGWKAVENDDATAHFQHRTGQVFNLQYYKQSSADDPFEFVYSNNGTNPLDNSVLAPLSEFDFEATYELLKLLINSPEVTKIEIDPEVVSSTSMLVGVDLNLFSYGKLIVREEDILPDNEDNDGDGEIDEEDEVGIRRDMDSSMRISTRVVHVNLLAFDETGQIPDWEEQRPYGLGVSMSTDTQIKASTIGLAPDEFILKLVYNDSQITIDEVISENETVVLSSGDEINAEQVYEISILSTPQLADFSDIALQAFYRGDTEPFLSDTVSVINVRPDLTAFVGEMDDDIVSELDESLPNGIGVYFAEEENTEAPDFSVGIIGTGGGSLRLFYDDDVVSIINSDYQLSMRSGYFVDPLNQFNIDSWIDSTVTSVEVTLKFYTHDGVFISEDAINLTRFSFNTGIDLDIDSDNNNGPELIIDSVTNVEDLRFTAPDRSALEDSLEEKLPGKLVLVNDEDTDGDLIPDFADGFDIWLEGSVAAVNKGDHASKPFVPIVMKLTETEVDWDELQGLSFSFNYEDSNPLSMVLAEVQSISGQTIPKIEPATGYWRIWNRDGIEGRDPTSIGNGGNFIPSLIEISALDLGFTPDIQEVILYLECVRETPDDDNDAHIISIRQNSALADQITVSGVHIKTQNIEVDSLEYVDYFPIAISGLQFTNDMQGTMWWSTQYNGSKVFFDDATEPIAYLLKPNESNFKRLPAGAVSGTRKFPTGKIRILGGYVAKEVREVPPDHEDYVRSMTYINRFDLSLSIYIFPSAKISYSPRARS